MPVPYPISVHQPVHKTVENLVNRSYRGHTYQYTVAEHLEAFTDALERAKEDCKRHLANSAFENESKHWAEALTHLEAEFAEPHDCNTDYTEYMIKDMPTREIVDNSSYNNLSIGDIRRARKLRT